MRILDARASRRLSSLSRCSCRHDSVSDGIWHLVDESCALQGRTREETLEAQGLGRHYASSFKGSFDLDWSDAQEKRTVVGQLVADARVALRIATRALRGVAKKAAVANPMRVAAASGRASSDASIFALLVGMASLPIWWLADPARLLKLAPSRPGF